MTPEDPDDPGNTRPNIPPTDGRFDRCPQSAYQTHRFGSSGGRCCDFCGRAWRDCLIDPPARTRGDGEWCGVSSERPRPLGPAEALIRALVIAWDMDDERGFEIALTAARLYTGLTLPAVAPRATESRPREVHVPLPFERLV